MTTTKDIISLVSENPIVSISKEELEEVINEALSKKFANSPYMSDEKYSLNTDISKIDFSGSTVEIVMKVHKQINYI